MSDNSRIEWTDATWNPVTGCSKVSRGCKNCFAERFAKRGIGSFAGHPFTEVRCHPERLDQPMRWRRPRKIFVNSLSDLFHPDVPSQFIAQVFTVMAACPQHTFQILTKRPDRMCRWTNCVGRVGLQTIKRLPNLWLGVSIEDQNTANGRIPWLLQTNAAVKWVSCEPLLGAVDLRTIDWLGRSINALTGTVKDNGWPESHMKRPINWVVVGGESGPKARPMHPGWVRSLRDQCWAAGVPFLFKQWGEWCPVCRNSNSNNVHIASSGIIRASKFCHIDFNGHDYEEAMQAGYGVPESCVSMARVGTKNAGRILYGRLHDEYPKEAQHDTRTPAGRAGNR